MRTVVPHSSAMLLGNQQLSMFLSATVDSVPPDAEWQHFLKLNHVVLPDVPEKTLDDVQWDGKGHELTSVVMEGMLERQTSFLKSWKPGESRIRASDAAAWLTSSLPIKPTSF